MIPIRSNEFHFVLWRGLPGRSVTRYSRPVGKAATKPSAVAFSRQPDIFRNCSPVPLEPWSIVTIGTGSPAFIAVTADCGTHTT